MGIVYKTLRDVVTETFDKMVEFNRFYLDIKPYNAYVPSEGIKNLGPRETVDEIRYRQRK
jgi:hypothetical protein